MLKNNFFAFFLTLIISIVWLRAIDLLAHRGWLESKLSRKIIHIGTGPIFVLCWLLFQNTASARFLAAIVPLIITFQFFLIGIGVIKDEASVQAMSRTGNRKEILFGPLFYGVLFVLLTIIYWYDSPIGIIALMVLCGGDGFAEIIGRKYGRSKIPWSKTKTWAGFFGMFAGGWLFSLLVISIFIALGLFPGNFVDYLLPISAINFAATLTESLPIKEIDNITITVASVLFGHLFF
jgi:phytol kinase